MRGNGASVYRRLLDAQREAVAARFERDAARAELAVTQERLDTALRFAMTPPDDLSDLAAGDSVDLIAAHQRGGHAGREDTRCPSCCPTLPDPPSPELERAWETYVAARNAVAGRPTEETR